MDTKKSVYVLTWDERKGVGGVFSTFSKATVALFCMAGGKKVLAVNEQNIGVEYKFVSLETGEVFTYFIEEMTMDDPMWYV